MNVLFRWIAPLLAGCVCAALPLVHADAPGGTGVLEGSVYDASSGHYLAHASVAVQGTANVTLSDEIGHYALSHVPAGPVTVVVTYTGIAPVPTVITVAPGQVTRHDFTVAANDQTVQLDAFVIQASRTMDNNALAINEQRVSPALKTVVAADAFGDVTEGNVGEFLKYLPGVAVEYTAADARQIILRGVNPIYTAVTVDGSRMASAASSNADRYFELEQASINNVSRVEVVFARTPDLPADALGGSVNMISKNAFDYSHFVFNYRAYLTMNSDAQTLRPTSGPFEENSHKTLPGFDFSLIAPVSPRFGLVLSYLSSNIYYPQNRTQDFWAPVTSSGAGSTAANPFLHTYQLMVGPKDTGRRSFSAAVDGKLSDEDTVALNFQWNFYDGTFGNRILQWNIQGTSNTAPVSFDSDGAQGAKNAGNTAMSTSFRHKFGATYHLAPTFTHAGPDWSYDAGLAFSHATNHYSDVANGAPDNFALSQNNLTVGFAGLNAKGQAEPSTITTTNSSGAAVDTFNNLGSYTINSMVSDPANSEDVFKTAKANVSRKWDLRWPTTIKSGALVQAETRDIRKVSDTFDFVGPDGTKNTADDLVSNYLPNYNLVDGYSGTRSPWGLPSVTWASPYGAWDLYKAHPEWYALQSNATTIKNSQYFQERISSAYVMGDTRSPNGKLQLVYGIRFERTDDTGEGYLFNPNAIYQHAANGSLVLGSNGKPVPLTATTGLPLNATSGGNTSVLDATAVQASNLEYTDRGSHVKDHYGDGFPSLDLIYHFTPNFLGRLEYTRAIGRPDLTNIIPGVTLPDPSSATPYAITVNNTALKPEMADNYDAQLEYYFGNVGVISAGVFRKDFTNFYGSVTELATADELNALGIPNADYYLQNAATITSKFNIGEARVTGFQAAYNQQLTWLPIRGFSVFANAFMIHLQGAPYADFSNFLPKSINWGVGYDTRKFSAKLNWNYRGQEREGTLSGDVGAYNYFAARLQMDCAIEYRLFPHVGLFATGRNLTNVYQDYLGYGQTLPAYAHLQRRDEFGAQYTFGLKGQF